MPVILPEGVCAPAWKIWPLMYNCGPAAGLGPAGPLKRVYSALPAAPDPHVCGPAAMRRMRLEDRRQVRDQLPPIPGPRGPAGGEEAPQVRREPGRAPQDVPHDVL